MRKSIFSLLIVLLFANSTLADDFNKGYKIGLKALSTSKSFMKNYKKEQAILNKAKSDSQKYLAVNRMKAGAKGACLGLTYNNMDPKMPNDYYAGFEKGCLDGFSKLPR